MKKIKVMIVEDSQVIREYLEGIISRDARLEVVSSVGTAEEALKVLNRVSPDVISMDIRLPGMNGFEATQRIMSEKPTPIVVVSASVEAEDLKVSMNALRAGALTVLEKPVGLSHANYEKMATHLCTQLAIMSKVKVIRQRYQRPSLSSPKTTKPNRALERSSAALHQFKILGVVTSTGGPSALITFLGGLPKNFPLPILLVQHIVPTFLEGFVKWLSTVNPFPVEFAENGTVPLAGKIYVATAEHHLTIDRGVLRLDPSEPVCLQRPSGTVLFNSMAKHLGSQALGVLLTGMGRDGADGLLAIREAGGYTIAEDESTAVVYGMPAVAVEIGGVSESLPLPEIAPRLLEIVVPQKLKEVS